MANWIHCNKCSIIFNQKLKFYLSECGHLFCEQCVTPIKSSRKCPVCSKTTAVLLLNKDSGSHIQEYFEPVENHIKKIVEVFKFQEQHRNLQFKTLRSKYEFAKKECINQTNAVRQLRKENQLLKAMLQNINQGSNGERNGTDNRLPFLTSTPMSNNNVFNNSGQFTNQSLSSMPNLNNFTIASRNNVSNMLNFNENRRPSAQGMFANVSSQRPSPSLTSNYQQNYVGNRPGTMFTLDELKKFNFKSK